jgi:hypothetical protein
MNDFSRPRHRNLDADEAADLAGQRGPFSGDELARFEAYCAALYRLGELSGVVCDGVARPHPCQGRCGKTVPAGTPSGWVNSKWDLCPACVRAKRMISTHQHGEPGAIDRELLAYCTGDVQDEMRAFFGAVAKVGQR